MGIHKKRELFELLPEVNKRLSRLHPTIVWFGEDGLYHTSSNFKELVDWLNGGFYVFQQLHKDEEVKKHKEQKRSEKAARGFECAREAMFRPWQK